MYIKAVILRDGTMEINYQETNIITGFVPLYCQIKITLPLLQILHQYFPKKEISFYLSHKFIYISNIGSAISKKMIMYIFNK